MAVNPAQEMIWEGCIHIGDEPGVYGCAQYAGLCAVLPITVSRSTFQQPTTNPFKVILETEGLETYAPYPGHSIAIVAYLPDPSNPTKYVQKLLVNDTFTSADNNRKEVDVPPQQGAKPVAISVSLCADLTVPPGLYDDFVWRRLSLSAQNYEYYASLGFQFTP